MKILVCGLPGAGKTTLATQLAKQLNAIHLNSDRMAAEELTTFGLLERQLPEIDSKLQAYKLKFISNIIDDAGHTVIIDFVCNTNMIQRIVDPDVIVWLDTKPGTFERPLSCIRLADYAYNIENVIRRLNA